MARFAAMPGLLASDRPGKMPTLCCKFAAKGAEEDLRGAVAFGNLGPLPLET